jgi:hypothetical protein
MTTQLQRSTRAETEDNVTWVAGEVAAAGPLQQCVLLPNREIRLLATLRQELCEKWPVAVRS